MPAIFHRVGSKGEVDLSLAFLLGSVCGTHIVNSKDSRNYVSSSASSSMMIPNSNNAIETKERSENVSSVLYFCC